MTVMTPRGRVLAALDLREPDRVPIDLGTVASGITVDAYERLKGLLGVGGETRVWRRRRLAEVDESILKLFDVDTRHLVAEGPISESVVGADELSYTDAWGVIWQAVPGHPFMPTRGPFDAGSDLSTLRSHPWPDPTNPAYTRGLEAKARECRRAGDHAIVMGLSGRVFTLGQFMCGFEEWCVRLLQDPTFAMALMDRGLEIQMEIIARQLEAVGEDVDVVFVSEDLGMQSAPLMSPRLYRDLIWPRHKTLFEFIRGKTSARLVLHSDGAIRDLLPHLIDAGIQGINPVQVSAEGMEARRLKREFGGRLAFWGGIDTRYVLPRGTTGEVREEVRRCIGELAPCGGYILASVHNIQPEVPPQNVRAMVQAAHEFGRYPIALRATQEEMGDGES